MPSQTMKSVGYANLGREFCASQNLELLSVVFQQTLKEKSCVLFDNCDVTLSSFCGNTARRMLSPRNLQSSGSWQVVYEVTVSFSCAIASCSSPEDTGTFSAVSSTIRNSITGSINNGEFMVSLRKNLEINSEGSNGSLPTCLTVTGMTEEPVPEIAVILYYPDWKDQSGTCLSDGNEPFYIAKDRLFDSLEKCCNQHYSGMNKNLCMHTSGSGLWYVRHALGKCVKDCKGGSGETCGGLVNLASDDLFTNPRNCCERKLPWVFTDFCEVSS